MPTVLRYIFAVLFMPLAQVSAMHPFHLSTAEMELNSKTGRIEVALKIHGDDLQRALAFKSKRKEISLKNDAESHKLIAGYLSEHFVLASSAGELREWQKRQLEKSQVKGDAGESVAAQEAAGDKSDGSGEVSERKPSQKKLSQVHVLGSEYDKSWLWVYFELELPQLESDAVLLNSLLLDVTDGQINTIQIRNKYGRTAFRTRRQPPTIDINPEWFAKENAIRRP